MSGDPNYGPGPGDPIPMPPPPASVNTGAPLTERQGTIAIVATVIIAIIGLLGGLAIIGLGIYMILHGVTGSVDLSMSSGGNKMQVKTVVIGVIVAVIGVAVIALTGIQINKGVKNAKNANN